MRTYIRRWNRWRKFAAHSFLYQLLVLLGVIISPTFECARTDEEISQAILDGFEKGLNARCEPIEQAFARVAANTLKTTGDKELYSHDNNQ